MSPCGKQGKASKPSRQASKTSTTSKGSMGSVLSHLSAISERFRRMSSSSTTGLGSEVDPEGRGGGVRRKGFSPVHFKKEKILKQLTSALERRDNAALEEVLDGIDLSELEDSETSIFTYRACDGEDLASLAVLLRHGAGVNAVGEEGKFPLHISTVKKNCAMVALLLSNGANPNIGSAYEEKTPLHYATLQGACDIIELLLNNGANVNQRDIYGGTPLHIACHLGNKQALKLLLDNRANIDAYDKQGWTGVHLASEAGKVEIVRVLAENRANLDCQTKHGRTALHWACDSGQLGTVHELLQMGAKANISDLHDRVALEYCKYETLSNLVDAYTERPEIRKQFASSLNLDIELKKRPSPDDPDGVLFAASASLEGRGLRVPVIQSLSIEAGDVMDELETIKMAQRQRKSHVLGTKDFSLADLNLQELDDLTRSREESVIDATPDTVHTAVTEMVTFVIDKAKDAAKSIENYVQKMTALCNTGLSLQGPAMLQHIPTLQTAGKALESQARSVQKKEKSIASQLSRIKLPEAAAQDRKVYSFRYTVMTYVFMTIVEEYIAQKENGWQKFVENLKIPRDVTQLLSFRLQVENLGDAETCRQLMIQWASIRASPERMDPDFIRSVLHVVLKCDFEESKVERSNAIFSKFIQTYLHFKTETAVDERSQKVVDLLASLSSKEKSSLLQVFTSSDSFSDLTILNSLSKRNSTDDGTGDDALVQDAKSEGVHDGQTVEDENLNECFRNMLEERDEHKLLLVVKFLVNGGREELLARLL